MASTPSGAAVSKNSVMKNVDDNESTLGYGQRTFKTNLNEARTNLKDVAQWRETFNRECDDNLYYKEVTRSRNENKRCINDVKREMKKALVYCEDRVFAREFSTHGTDIWNYRGTSVTNEGIRKESEAHIQEGLFHLKEVTSNFDLFEWHCKERKAPEEADRYRDECKRHIKEVKRNLKEAVGHYEKYLSGEVGQNWKDVMY